MGNCPAAGWGIFSYATEVNVYYLPGTTGWGATFGGRPALLWNPTFTEATLGGVINAVVFTISGTEGIPIAVTATTNLLAGPWETLLSTNLVGGALDFADTAWTSFPMRFYRIVGH